MVKVFMVLMNKETLFLVLVKPKTQSMAQCVKPSSQVLL